MKTFLIFLALGLGNFSYQYTHGTYDYQTAFERTYFQGVALLIYFLITKLFKDER